MLGAAARLGQRAGENQEGVGGHQAGQEDPEAEDHVADAKQVGAPGELGQEAVERLGGVAEHPLDRGQRADLSVAESQIHHHDRIQHRQHGVLEMVGGVGGVGQPEQQGAVATFGSGWLGRFNGLGRWAAASAVAGAECAPCTRSSPSNRSNGNQATQT